MDEDVLDSIQKLGQKSYKEYYTVGGMLDIFSGLYLIAACYIISIHKVSYWLFTWWILAFIVYGLQAIFRHLIIVPRIGVAKFSDQTKEPLRYRTFYLQFIFIFFFFTIWASLDPHFLPAVNIVMCLNFGIIQFARNIRYYLVLAFASIPFVYPYYFADYENILICAFFLLIFSVIIVFLKWLRKNGAWEPKILIPKPRNFKQVAFTLLGAIVFEALLFTMFRPDLTAFLRNYIAVNTTMTVGILAASLIGFLGIIYKTNRLYLYAGFVLVMSLLTHLSYRLHFIPGALLLIAGLIIVITGGVILRNFIKNNPIIKDDNFLEDKVLDDTGR
jgi:hypothetical protein